MSCAHENFESSVTIQRLVDVRGFFADIVVRCADCGEPFRFIGPRMGLLPSEPTVSPDGCELSVPMLPKSDPRAVAPMAGFAIERRQ